MAFGFGFSAAFRHNFALMAGAVVPPGTLTIDSGLVTCDSTLHKCDEG